ncbi:Ferritin Light Chain [Manis pentadactyla]|nr:Ferritin Light Chain [Manis pentadactyla]
MLQGAELASLEDRKTPQFCDFWENCILDEQVKFMKTSNRLTNLLSYTGLDEYIFERLTRKHD